ncbi:MAG: DMT family transporter [Alphaproteobacteria bacterium]|nr:DMT family transporter [Alphaproteobacteria bacterium]
MSTTNTKLIGVVYMLMAMLIFSCANALIKDVVANYSMVQIIFFRSFFSLLPMLYLMHLEGGLKIMKTDQHPRFIALGLMGMGAFAGLFGSISHLPLAEAVSIHFSEIFILTAMSAWFLKEKVSLCIWVAIAVGFCGVLIVYRPTGDFLNIGAVYGLIFAIGDSIYMLNARILTRNHSATAVVIYFGLVISCLSGLLLPWFWITPDGESLARMILLGLGGGIGLYCVTQAYKHAPARVVAPMIYSALIWNMILGYLFWQDTPDNNLIMGALLIVSSGLYIIYAETREKTPAIKTEQI